MLSIIKTAIITIIISFISGVLLDSYKNFAPRILCSMEKPVRLKINNKRVWAFTFIMKNISNKTIHNLSLNIQGHYDNLKIDEAKITKGLKFETSNENNNYNVSIPFLSKDDEFSTKIFVENTQGTIKKPLVTLRSPENFKQVNGFCKNGYFATIAGIPKDISESLTNRKHKKQGTNSENKKINSKDKSFFNYRTMLVTVMGIVVLIYAVIWINKLQDNKTVVTQQQNDSLKESEATSKSSSTESKTNLGSSKNTTNNNTSKNKVSNDSSNKKSSEESNKNSKDTKTNNDTKGSSSSTAKKNNANSVGKDESQIDNKKSKTENNKTSSEEDSITDKSNTNTNNTQNSQQSANTKNSSDKAGDQEKNKLQGSDSSDQEQQKSSTPTTENK